MTKKSKKKNNSKSNNKNEIQTLPVTLPFKKISTIKSIHDKTINFCFLSKTNNYIILNSTTCFSILDPNNFQVLSKNIMDSQILYVIELTNNRILLLSAKMMFVYEVIENKKLNLLYYYEEKITKKWGL